MTTITKVQNHMLSNDIDLLFFDDPLTVAYLTGFESDPHERVAAAVIFKDTFWLIVPELEVSNAKTASGYEKIISYKDEESPWQLLKEAMESDAKTPQKIGIDEDSLIVSRYHALKDIFPHASFVNSVSLIQKLRVVKQPYEIDIMKKAGELADKALEIGISSLKNGISEEEVVALIEYEIKKYGVKEMSFPTMVLFGDHAASPHGEPGTRKLKPDEWVLFDLGVVYNGYTSDMTRTVIYGQADEKTKEIYTVVKEAQEKAQAIVMPGITAAKIDQEARNHIKKAGYGEYFTHRLGHGLGKSVHEFPNIAPGVNISIEENMCFSIEPGIYIENFYGVRIEDCIYVSKDGALPLTHTSKDLIEVAVKE